jgi:hypothetical protein
VPGKHLRLLKTSRGSTTTPHVIHRLVRKQAYGNILEICVIRVGPRELSTMMPTAWTMSAFEAAIFVAIVVGLAGAGAWASVG